MINKLIKSLARYLPENNRLERIWILAKFDFKSRYYYHQLGVLWALIKPLFEFLIYYLVFTFFFKSNVPNFALYLFLGLILWNFFIEGTNKGITVLPQRIYLIENISFNKNDLFLSSTFSASIGFLFNFTIYLLLSLIFGIIPVTLSTLFFPFILLNFFVLIMGIGLIIGTLSIFLKDIAHLWDMLLLLGFWITPILYDKAMIEESAAWLLYANPVAGIIINAREVLLYGQMPDFYLLGSTTAYAWILFMIGYIAFNKYSHKIAEKI